MDFPKHHPALTGKQIKYCYTAVLSGPIATGVAKVDVATGAIVGKIEFPPGCFAGDTVFVPAKGSQSAWSASQRGAKTVEGAEDEGYLLTFVNDETKGNTAEVRDFHSLHFASVMPAHLACSLPPGVRVE